MAAETKRMASGRQGERRRSRGDGGGARQDQGGGSQPRPKNATREEQQWMDKNRDKLSRTTLRAKWTHGPDEHEDRAGQTLATRSHEVIRSWADARGAQPVTVGARQDGRPRTLRFTFPQGEGGRGRLEPISWDDWFRSFDERELVFITRSTAGTGAKATSGGSTTRVARRANAGRERAPEDGRDVGWADADRVIRRSSVPSEKDAREPTRRAPHEGSPM